MTEHWCDVVMVAYNAGYILQRSLGCVARCHAAAGLVRRLIIVENGSSDGSQHVITDFVAAHRSWAQLIEPGRNVGFAAGCNLGASHCTSSNILFLNPDVVFDVRTLRVSLAALGRPCAKKVGVVGVKLRDAEGRESHSASRFPRAWHYAAEASGVNRVIPSRLTRRYLPERSLEGLTVVDEVCGAFFLVRCQLWDELSGFDERFYIYFEEVDFCKRARAAGWLSCCCGEATATHAGARARRRVGRWRLYHSLRSRLLYFRKHHTYLEYLAVLGVTVICEPLARLVYGLLRLDLRYAREVCVAYRWFVQWVSHSGQDLDGPVSDSMPA